jgi:hypothetical protein
MSFSTDKGKTIETYKNNIIVYQLNINLNFSPFSCFIFCFGQAAVKDGEVVVFKFPKMKLNFTCVTL